jgi:hypothetical protein
MRKAILFSAVAMVAFFVTIGGDDVSARLEAGFRGDFEPAAPIDVLRLSPSVPQLPFEEFSAV